MKLPLHLANNLFKQRLTVFDEIAECIRGRTVIRTDPTRNITGTIQTDGDTSAQLLPDGQQSDGALILHTNSPVSIFDNSQPQQKQRQTILEYQGEYWKITRLQNWQDHIQTGINRYGLVKYVPLDASIEP